jgi:hypothetical protein
MPRMNHAFGNERRAQVRYSLTLQTSFRRLGRDGTASWGARVRNVSRTGAALVMAREVMAGAVLAVTLEGLRGRFARPVLMRVNRVRSEGDSRWVVGCTFVTPLADADIEEMVMGCCAADRKASRLPF